VLLIISTISLLANITILLTLRKWEVTIISLPDGKNLQINFHEQIILLIVILASAISLSLIYIALHVKNLKNFNDNLPIKDENSQEGSIIEDFEKVAP
jgi:ABC-type antimicrobial peptide transport system ATPase subunit